MGAYVGLLIAISLALLCEQGEYRIPKKSYFSVQNVAICLISLLLLFLSSLRYDTGADTLGYYNDYVYINTSSIFLSNQKYEYGYVLLNKLLWFFTHNAQVIIIVTSCITNILIISEIKKASCFPLTSIFCYVCFYFYFLSFNVLRQFLAIAIVFYANKWLLSDEKRGMLKYAISCCIGVLIHSSTLLPLLTCLFIKKKQTLLVKLIIVIVFFVFLLMGETLSKAISGVIPKYSIYFDYGRTGSTTSSILLLGVLLLGSWIIDSCGVFEIANYAFFQNCIAMGLLLNVIAMTNVLFSRVASFYTINLILFFPSIIKKINKQRFWVHLSIVVFGLLYCIWNLLNNNGGVVPYRLYQGG